MTPRTGHAPCVASIALAIVCTTAPAFAQSPGPPGRVEIGGGLLWIGAQSLGTRAANETTGAGGTLPLFTATSTLAAVPAVDVRVGVRLTRKLDAEVSASYGRPSLRVQLGSDSESAPSVTATEVMQQFMFSGGASWYVPRRRPSRVLPFVTGSVGYLRQLHENATLVQTGQVYQIGGGAKVMLTSRVRKHLKGAGVRLDARAVMRSKGIAFDGGRSTSPGLGASLFVRF